MALVSTTRRGAVATVRLQRPETRNAMNTELLAALLEAFGEVFADDDVACVVVTGAGLNFSSGADRKEPLEHEGDVRRIELFGEVFATVAAAPVPTVAAIKGPCIGAGAELAAACDIRVADPTASFRFPGAVIGYPIGAAKLVSLVGLGTAKDLVLTARRITAEEAARIGFVQHLVGDDQAMATARDLAERISRHDREVVAYLKRLFDQFSGLSDRIAVENDVLVALARTGGDYSALRAQHRGAGGWVPADRPGE